MYWFRLPLKPPLMIKPSHSVKATLNPPKFKSYLYRTVSFLCPVHRLSRFKTFLFFSCALYAAYQEFQYLNVYFLCLRENMPDIFKFIYECRVHRIASMSISNYIYYLRPVYRVTCIQMVLCFFPGAPYAGW